eukprot:g15877.t1
MENLSDVLTSKTWPLPTQHPTFAIGLSFIFLAYFLHPRIESAYQRVRASRAWWAVQKHKRVDVTDYPMLSEAFGTRGREWDAARTVTVLLAAFSLVSWMLELSLDIYHIEANAYLLTEPPHVYKHYPESQNLTWEVLPLEEINPDYDGQWLNKDHNMFDNQAKSRYYIKGYREYAWSTKVDTYKNGEIVVASWDPAKKPKLFYGSANTVTVDSITCSGTGDPLVEAAVNLDSVEWGSVLECGEGPRVTTQSETSQPAIILTDSSTGAVHVIVEEVGTHPSFLYSVWTAEDANSVELAYTFHISSTVRLAEAVMTGIVHGYTDGGSCFGLLRAFSRGDDTVDTSISYPSDRFERAKPFGEKPEDGIVDSLQEVETLEAGVLLDANALVASATLGLLSLVGIVWSMCLKSSVEMDVYDRDELIRAISQQAQGEENDPSKREKMRIYVQKERGGELNVIISESDDDHNGCMRFLLRRQPTPSVHPVPVADTVRHALDEHGGAPLPLGRPRMYLGGIRSGMGRAYPGPNNNFRYPISVASSVALSASPVPSTVPTPINSNIGSASATPAPNAAAPPRARQQCFPLPDVGVSSPIPSVAESSAGTSAPDNSASAAGTPCPSNPASEAGAPVAPSRSPRSPGFLSSFAGMGRRGAGRGLGDFGVAGRGASVLFDSFNTFGDDGGGGGGGGGSSVGGETDGDGTCSAGTDMGSGALAGAHVSAFGGDDASVDVEMGTVAMTRPPQLPAFGGDADGDVDRESAELAHAQAPASGGHSGGDVEMGRLVLVRPQSPCFACDPGKPNASGGGSGSGSGVRVNTTAGQAGDGAGDIDGDGEDPLHFPSDRTTPPASPEVSPLPSRGVTTVETLGPQKLGALTRTSV